MDAAIQIEALNFTYPGSDLPLYEGFDLEIGQGKTTVMLGPNGAGKTTLLRILLGFEPIFEGEIKLLGHSIASSELLPKIGFLNEQPTRFEFLSKEQYLSTFLNASSDHRANWEELIENIPADLPMKNYSKGMLQRLNFVRLLQDDPELIFLDEPATGLDPIGQQQIINTVLKLKELNKTILVNTHDLQFALDVADQILVLVKGKVAKRIERDEEEYDAQKLKDWFLSLSSPRS